MPTPLDKTRAKAFRAWLRSIGNDLDVVSARTGIGRRSLERMQRGTQPPPVRLLDQLAQDAAARGLDALAGELAGAATPAEITHA